MGTGRKYSFLGELFEVEVDDEDVGDSVSSRYIKRSFTGGEIEDGDVGVDGSSMEDFQLVITHLNLDDVGLF